MTDVNQKPGTIFWVAGGLFLLWNLMGCGIYLMEATMSDAAYLEAYGEKMADARDVYPVWATAFYAIAVWGGLLAAILFLLRKRVSATLFIVSLIAALICFIPTFTSDVLRDAAGSSFWVMPVIVVILGAVEVWYSRKQSEKGVLR